MRRWAAVLLTVGLAFLAASPAAAQDAVPEPVRRLAQAVDELAAVATGTDPHAFLRRAAEYLSGSKGSDLVVAGLRSGYASAAFIELHGKLVAVKAALDALEQENISWTPEAVSVYTRSQEKFRSVPRDLFWEVMNGLGEMASRPPSPVTGTAFQDEARRIREQGLDVLSQWDALLQREWPKPSLSVSSGRKEIIDVDAVDLWTSFPAAVLLFIGGLLFLAAGSRWKHDPKGSWRFAAGGMVYGLVGYTLSYAPQAAQSFNRLFAGGYEELAWGVLFFSLAFPLGLASYIANKNDMFPGLFYSQGLTMIRDAWRGVVGGLQQYGKRFVDKIRKSMRR